MISQQDEGADLWLLKPRRFLLLVPLGRLAFVCSFGRLTLPRQLASWLWLFAPVVGGYMKVFGCSELLFLLHGESVTLNDFETCNS